MPEEVLFEDERHADRAEVARYLRTVADKLEAGGSVSFEAGGDELSVDVPEAVEFEVKVEREGPVDGPKDIGLELELEWPEDGHDGAHDDSLSIS